MPGMSARIKAYEAAHPETKGERHSYRSLFNETAVPFPPPELDYKVEVNSFANRTGMGDWTVANFSALLAKADEPELLAMNEWYDVLLPGENNTAPG